MQCEQCQADNPELARFCWRCGRSVGRRSTAATQRAGSSYSVAPGENVVQLALISTLLPHANRGVADDYRWAFMAGSGLTLFLTVVGLLPAALVMGAFLLPIAYLVYMHDVDLWEGRPGVVVGSVYVLTGLLAVGISLVFFRLFGDAFGGMLFAGGDRGGIASLPLPTVALFGVALPVVSVLAMQVGGVILARRPEFDDMLDGFTFGSVSGMAYAAFETVIAFGTVFSAAGLLTGDSLGTWLVVMLNLMILKPVIYGASAGVAVAAFSGKGANYDGFSGLYVREVLFAMGANVLYWLGIRLLAPAPFGAALGLFWGALVAAGLIVRARAVLQAALLESALEDAARDARPKHATTELGYCPECENPLLPDAAFCVVCGSSVRATSASGRRQIRQSAPEAGR